MSQTRSRDKINRRSGKLVLLLFAVAFGSATVTESSIAQSDNWDWPVLVDAIEYSLGQIESGECDIVIRGREERFVNLGPAREPITEKHIERHDAFQVSQDLWHTYYVDLRDPGSDFRMVMRPEISWVRNRMTTDGVRSVQVDKQPLPAFSRRKLSIAALVVDPDETYRTAGEHPELVPRSLQRMRASELIRMEDAMDTQGTPLIHVTTLHSPNSSSVEFEWTLLPLEGMLPAQWSWRYKMKAENPWSEPRVAKFEWTRVNDVVVLARMTRTCQDARESSEEIWSFTWHSVNQPLDPNLFTAAAMKMERGDYHTDYTLNPPLTTILSKDDVAPDRILAAPAAAPPPEERAPVARRPWTHLFLPWVVAHIILLIYCAWRRWAFGSRRQRGTS